MYCNVIRSFPHLQKKPFPHWKYQPLLSMNFSSFTEWQFYIIWKNLHQNTTFQFNSMLKFVFSNKTKLMKSSPSIWHLLNNVKWPVKILSIFVAFLENLNVRVFLEGHKNWWNLHRLFDTYYIMSNHRWRFRQFL